MLEVVSQTGVSETVVIKVVPETVVSGIVMLKVVSETVCLRHHVIMYSN